MSSTSEKSFGSRIENARKLKTNLLSFPNYQPTSGEFSIDDLSNSIQTIETLNPEVATALINYRQSVSQRREIFIGSPFAIKRIITFINSYNRAKFGKEATSYIALNALVKKIRGTQLKQEKTTNNVTYSVFQQSFGSITLNFQNLITDLETLGTDYNPANENIQINKLINLKNQAVEKNNNVVTAFSVLIPKQNTRIELYNALSAKAIRIKDFVKSQYGADSSQYKLIKKLII
jgi:hypothetical protein